MPGGTGRDPVAPPLVLDRVDVRFGATTALAGLSLALAGPGTLALVGESGSGKSTVLRLAVGLVPPSAGSVRTLAGDPAADRALRRRVGYVIQEGGLFPHLDGEANVALPAVAAGWARARITARLRTLTDLVGLTPAQLARRPAALSGGQRQRLSLMRALMLEPELLLLDEPLGALDPLIRFELQDDLKALFETLELAVVFVTHDLAEAAWFTDDIAVLRSGRLLQRGSLAELRGAAPDSYVGRLLRAVRELPP